MDRPVGKRARHAPARAVVDELASAGLDPPVVLERHDLVAVAGAPGRDPHALFSDVAAGNELGTTTARQLLCRRVVACHKEERPAGAVRVLPRREGAIDHLGSAATLEPAVTKVGREERRVPFSEAERGRGLPGVAEAADGFELLRAVVADERSEDAARPDRSRSSHTFVSRNRACLQGEVGPRERT